MENVTIGNCQNLNLSAGDVKIEIPAHVRSLKSSILSVTSLQMDKTFLRVVNAAVEESRPKANMVTWETGNLALKADPSIPPKPNIFQPCVGHFPTPKK